MNPHVQQQDSEPPVLDSSGLADFEAHASNTAAPDADYWRSYMKKSDMSSFLNQAYANDDGLAIRLNPVTGKKELFIAGTRTKMEWGQNVLEGGSHAAHAIDKVYALLGKSEDAPSGPVTEAFKLAGGFSEHQRENFAAYIDEIIELEQIEVVYGHSRGAATMSDLKSSGVHYVGIDGASFIGKEKDYVNLQNTALGGFGFDKLIGAGHKGNIGIGGQFHNVTLEKGAKKRPAPAPTIQSRERIRKRKGGDPSYPIPMLIDEEEQPRSSKRKRSSSPKKASGGKKKKKSKRKRKRR